MYTKGGAGKWYSMHGTYRLYTIRIMHYIYLSLGCGTLWSIDGLWKLVYPICMHKEAMEVSGFSGQLKYIESCPNQPLSGKALCKLHCTEAIQNHIPTKLKEYLSFIHKREEGMYLYLHICISIIVMKST